MDAPVETHLESIDYAGHGLSQLPELTRSRSQTTTADGPLPSLRKRKSLRTRPDVSTQQYAGPLLPLNDTVERPELRSRRSSKMSLFHLFSKPKVEKLRGYTEPDLDLKIPPGPVRANSNNAVIQAKPDINVRIQNADAEQGLIRPATSSSYTARGARFVAVKDRLPPIPTDRKVRVFDPPPLFQVWPQARKHGVLEVSSVTPEVVLHKSKSRSSLFDQGNNVSSLTVAGNRASSTVVKSAVRGVANGSISTQSLPERVFVLTTSGYLLQYANEGPADRLPEKLLQLGKDSAAYASDLIPGRHHVIQIAQAVDQHGVMVSASHSLFSRLGRRNQTARRIASNFLLVMPGAQEMDSWMTAIRREIELQGGKSVRSDSVSSTSDGPKNGEGPRIDLRKMPSQSHRYQVKRDPTKPSIVTSPSFEALEAFPPVQGQQPQDQTTGSTVNTPDKVNDVDPPMPENHELKSRPRASSDTPSNTSSAGSSAEQQQLDKLRSSVRASHSTVATSVAAASRTNSITSTPPSDLSKDSSEGPRDPIVAKIPYRSLSSYTLAKRRSAAPLSLKDAPLPQGTKRGDSVHQKVTVSERAIDSPITGYGSPLPEPLPNSGRLAALHAQGGANVKDADDSSVNNNDATSAPATTIEERPESFIADLPDPTTWASRASPLNKGANMPMPSPLDTASMQQSADSWPSHHPPDSRPLRCNSNSFSVPLRAHAPDVSTPKTMKPSSEEADALSPIPAVTTLAAKVTSPDSSRVAPRQSLTFGSPSSVLSQSPKRLPSARLSLFPTATAPPFSIPQKDGLRRSPSATILQASAQAQVNGMRLARPTSLQVRSDHAPFLSSMRNNGAPTMQPRVAAVPIRSLKPSRSIAAMQTARAAPSFNVGSPTLVEEASDISTSLPEGPIARPPSRTMRGPRSSTSLPHLDFGMPVVGLGPPAPPPKAPLPPIPNAASRPQSPETGICNRSMAPIGVAINEAVNEAKDRPATAPAPAPMGLGIRVGGAD